MSQDNPDLIPCPACKGTGRGGLLTTDGGKHDDCSACSAEGRVPDSREDAIRFDMNTVRYMNSGGCRCPACGSDDFDAGSVEVDSNGASQDITCNNCGDTWIDCYTLTGRLPA